MKKAKLLFELKKMLEIEEEISKYSKIHQYPNRQTFCCWVNEYGGYFAYCHKDGRLITKTGHGEESCRTWSSVGAGVLEKMKLK